MGDAEVVLPGGNVAAAVVRVGATARKPGVAATPAVEALLDHLERAGFSGAPRSLGRDSQGRHVLEFVAGPLADTVAPMTPAELGRLGTLIADLHDCLEDFRPPPDAQWNVVIPPDRADLVCHHDLAPWNLVRSGDRWVFIDWDGAGPGSRLWDLAYAAQSFLPLSAGGDAAVDGPRLRALVDGYGLDEHQRRALPALIGAHTRGMYDLLARASSTGEQPWARLWAAGHGEHWGPAADYVEAHHDDWIAALIGRPVPTSQEGAPMFHLRPAVAGDREFLEEMALEAVNWTGEQRLTLAELRADRHLAHYTDHWPSAGDFGFVATDAVDRPIGAAWVRTFPASDPGYGFVAPDVPEMTLAVLADARGAGVGRALITALIDQARAGRLHRISLSVEDGNGARRLYGSIGFRVVGRDGTSDTMVLDLGRDPD